MFLMRKFHNDGAAMRPLEKRVLLLPETYGGVTPYAVRHKTADDLS